MPKGPDWPDKNEFVKHRNDGKPPKERHHDYGALFEEIGDGVRKLTKTVIDHSHEVLEGYGLVRKDSRPDAQVFRMDQYRHILPEDLRDLDD